MANKYVSERSYKKGSILWMESSKAMPYLFIVKEGQVKRTHRVLKNKDSHIYKKGDTFGLISCLTGHDYMELMEALTDCLLILVHKDNLIPFLTSDREIFLKIISDYSNRLRELNHKQKLLTSNSIYVEMPEQLLESAAYFRSIEKRPHCLYALKRYLKFSDDEKKKAEVTAEIAALEAEGEIENRGPERLKSRLIVKPGDIIFLEQERGEEFYLIEKGRVKISHFDREHDFILSLIGEGEFFGEMALLNQVSRSASAIAYEETRLLILKRDTLLDSLGDQVLIKIFISLAKRLWYSYRRVLNLYYRYPVTRLYDYLDLIITSKEGYKDEASYCFDFGLDELKKMTGLSEAEELEVAEFTGDDNIQLEYGQIRIMDLNRFKSTVNIEVNKERVNE